MNSGARPSLTWHFEHFPFALEQRESPAFQLGQFRLALHGPIVFRGEGVHLRRGLVGGDGKSNVVIGILIATSVSTPHSHEEACVAGSTNSRHHIVRSLEGLLLRIQERSQGLLGSRAAQPFAGGPAVPEVAANEHPLLVHMQDRALRRVGGTRWFAVAKSAGNRPLIHSPVLVNERSRSRPAGFGGMTGCTGLIAVQGEVLIKEDEFAQRLLGRGFPGNSHPDTDGQRQQHG